MLLRAPSNVGQQPRGAMEDSEGGTPQVGPQQHVAFLRDNSCPVDHLSAP